MKVSNLKSQWGRLLKNVRIHKFIVDEKDIPRNVKFSGKIIPVSIHIYLCIWFMISFRLVPKIPEGARWGDGVRVKSKGVGSRDSRAAISFQNIWSSQNPCEVDRWGDIVHAYCTYVETENQGSEAAPPGSHSYWVN